MLLKIVLVMIKLKHICLFYLFLIILFYLQGVIYEGGTIISKVVGITILLISLFYLFKTLLSNSIKKNSFYWGWFVFFILHITMISFAKLSIFGEFNDYSYGNAINIFLVSLSFFPIYYFSQKEIDLENYFIKFMMVMIPVSVLRFYISEKNIIAEKMIDNLDVLDVVNNQSYLFIYLFSFIYFIKNKNIFLILFFFIINFMTFQGAKRGAIISLILADIIYYFNYISSYKGKHKLYVFLSSLSVLFFLINIVYYYVSNNSFIMDRFSESGGSGRDTIYSNILSSWYGSESIFNFIFGYGYNSSINHSGSGHLAHNDWLELIINYGFLGFIIYFLLFTRCFLLIFYNNIPKNNRYMLITVLAVWLVSSMVSMNYMNNNSILQSILLAYIFSNKEFLKKFKGEFK